MFGTTNHRRPFRATECLLCELELTGRSAQGSLQAIHLEEVIPIQKEVLIGTGTQVMSPYDGPVRAGSGKAGALTHQRHGGTAVSNGLLLSFRGKGFASAFTNCLLHVARVLLPKESSDTQSVMPRLPYILLTQGLPRRCSRSFSQGVMPHIMLNDYIISRLCHSISHSAA